MEVDGVEEDADGGVFVEVAMGDNDVSVSFVEANAVPAVSDGEAFDGGLHGLDAFDTICFGVGAFDFEVGDGGHSFVCPCDGFER